MNASRWIGETCGSWRADAVLDSNAGFLSCTCTSCGRSTMLFVNEFKQGRKCSCSRTARKVKARTPKTTPVARPKLSPEEDRARHAARGRERTATKSALKQRLLANIWTDAEEEDDMGARADLMGRTFHKLTVVCGFTTGSGIDTVLGCRCACGRVRLAYATRTQLLDGTVKHCDRCERQAIEAELKRARMDVIQHRIEKYAIAA